MGCFLRFATAALLTIGAAQSSANEVLTLPSISLDQMANYEFQFHLRHRQNMMLLFWIRPWEQRDWLSYLQTVIEVSLTDHAGHTVCEAAGLIHDPSTKDRDVWILAGYDEWAFLAHRNCSAIKLRRSELYTLSIRIRDAGPMITNLSLTPRLVSSEWGP